jgi:hypothetical protein
MKLCVRLLPISFSNKSKTSKDDIALSKKNDDYNTNFEDNTSLSLSSGSESNSNSPITICRLMAFVPVFLFMFFFPIVFSIKKEARDETDHYNVAYVFAGYTINHVLRFLDVCLNIHPSHWEHISFKQYMEFFLSLHISSNIQLDRDRLKNVNHTAKAIVDKPSTRTESNIPLKSVQLETPNPKEFSASFKSDTHFIQNNQIATPSNLKATITELFIIVLGVNLISLYFNTFGYEKSPPMWQIQSLRCLYTFAWEDIKPIVDSFFFFYQLYAMIAVGNLFTYQIISCTFTFTYSF